MKECEREAVLGIPGCLADQRQLDTVAIQSGRKACMACLPELYDRRSQQALTDELTGLGNRWYLREKFDELMATSQNVGVLHIDLRKFKSVNEYELQEGGDKMLQAISHALLVQEDGDLAIRENTDAIARLILPASSTLDPTARIGGDEFVILYDLTPRKDVNAVLSREECEARLEMLGKRAEERVASLPEVIAFNNKYSLYGDDSLGIHYGYAACPPGSALNEILREANPDKSRSGELQ
jgi:GGDEF domain-containing protein